MHLPFLLSRGWNNFKKWKNNNKRRMSNMFDTVFPSLLVVFFISMFSLGMTTLVTNIESGDDTRCTNAYGKDWDHQNIEVGKAKEAKIQVPEGYEYDDYAACVKVNGDKTEYKAVPEKKDDN